MSGPGPDGYRAALEGAAVARRPDRARLRVTGRDPAAMLAGVVTNRVPEPATGGEGEAAGRGAYAAVLTPKGRMVADLRVVRGPRAEDGLLLDVPLGALDGLLEQLRRVLPPRMARADADATTAALTVAGPDAARLLTREALGLRVDAETVEALAEHAWVWADAGGPGVLVVRSGDLGVPAYDVVAEPRMVEALRERLLAAGAEPLEPAALEVLRVEAGRPAWGAELDGETIPTEAGLDRRAIDATKGCYTGQEVIVRIRDRGHVNRHLRGFRIAGGSLPAAGTEVWADGRDRPVGQLTSAVASPRAGGIALGYVRREVGVPGTLRLGGPDGERIAVVELPPTGRWWEAGPGAADPL